MYCVKVNVERAEAFKFNKNFQFPFDVVSHVDLNLERPQDIAPLKAEVSKSFFMSSKILLMTAQIPHRAFVPGQELSVNVDVKNKTKIEIVSLIISLWRISRVIG